MKVIGLKETNLDACVSEAQHERVVITRNGKPVALVVGVAGLDPEQLELGSNPAFWELITQRRHQRTITRAQLEEKIRHSDVHASRPISMGGHGEEDIRPPGPAVECMRLPACGSG